MKNLQVKNVPADVHRRIRRLAAQRGQTIRDLVLDSIRRELDRDEFQDRLARRAPVELGRAAARSLDEARAERERELGG
jgi:hypothetical protein